MREDKLNYIEYIKGIYFSKPFIAQECINELCNPKYKDLLFGFINGEVNKKMYIYDSESDIRLQY